MKEKLTEEQKIADRFLRVYAMVPDRLDSALERLERADSVQKSITGSIESMGLSSVNTDKLTNALSAIEKASSDISELAALFCEYYRQVEDFVTRIQRTDPKPGKVLRLIYIDGLTVEEVAKQMHYSEKMIREYKKAGLDIAFSLL